MKDCCAFCAEPCSRLEKVIDEQVNIAKRNYRLLDVLAIFKNSLFQFAKKNIACSICSRCTEQLRRCYEFILQVQEAQTQLKVILREVHPQQQQPISKDSIQSKALLREIRSKSKATLNLEAPPRATDSKPKRLYKCRECGDSFISFRRLKKHEESHVAERDQNICKGIICEYCCSLFANTEILRQHCIECHGDEKFMCLPCKKSYKLKGLLLNHIRKQHNHNTLLYYCTLCSGTDKPPFTSNLALQQHFQERHYLMASNDDNNQDMEMTEEFLDDFCLNSVDLRECWETLDFTFCEFLETDNCCDELDNTNKPVIGEYKCPQCSLSLENRNQLLRHLMEKHSMLVLQTKKCPYCSKTFNNGHNLKQHLLVVHAEVKKHICQLCDRQFATVDHLRKHVVGQHQNERNFLCHSCPKTFTQLCHLKQHILTHNSKKPYNCDTCENSFWRRIDLERHKSKNHSQI